MRALLLVLVSFPCWAATEVVQTLETSQKGQPLSAQYKWLIGDSGFKLTITTSAGSKEVGRGLYIFNGRNLYVCAKLDANQQAIINQLNFKDKELKKKILEGTCQTVSSNFLTRFYLSPMDAIRFASNDTELKLTYQVKGHAVSQSGEQSVAAGQKCTIYKRAYQVSSLAPTGSSMVSENICVDSNLDWRKLLWPEVSKTVLRQRKMGEIYKPIKADSQAMKGMILTSDQKGAKLTTASIVQNKKVQKSSFSPPKTFALLDRREFLTQVKLAVAQPANSKKAAPASEDKTSCQLLTLMTPAFLRVFGEGC